MRILLAMRAQAQRETLRLLLESERGDCQAFCRGDGRSALDFLRAHAPDMLLLDDVLPMLDGPAVLAELIKAPIPCPPKVILLLPPGREDDPLPPGADTALPAGADIGQILKSLISLEETLEGALAKLGAPARERRIQAFLRELGMPTSLKCQAYLTFLLNLLVPSPVLASALTHRLYPAAAARFSTSAAAVERCIRYGLESTWSKGDMAALERLFGLSVDPDRGKPTNREFLAMAAQHLRQERA